MASGRESVVRILRTDVAPCRFDNFVRSGPRISETCANSGTSQPSPINQHLPVRIRQMLLGADDVADLHLVIVDDDGSCTSADRRNG